MKTFGQQLVKSAKEALDIARGIREPARRFDVEVADVAATKMIER